MSDDELEKIRRNLSLERIIRRSATDWNDQSTGGRVGRCTHPEHGHTSDNSNAGNLIVTEDGGWYCYSHDTSGDLLSWIAIEENIVDCRDSTLRGDDFIDALEAAADRANVELDGRPSPDSYEEAEELDTLSDYEKAKYALDEAVDILHDNLNSIVGEKTVRGLIKEQRPFGDDVIDRLRIGYLDGEAYGELLRTLSEDALEDIGFKREDGGQHGEGRIIYPYYDRSLPSFWVGRRTDNSGMEAKYLKPHSSGSVIEEPVFEYEPERRDHEQAVWITEGIQDAVALAEAEGKSCVSPVCKDPSPKQKGEIIDAAQEEGKAVIAFDADEGGNGGAVRLAEDLMSAGVATEIAPFPDGTDPCDFFMDGRDFSEVEPVHAAKRIVEVKGDTDVVLRGILDTVAPDTPRANRLVATLTECTDVRADVLRDMIREERELAEQQGWREPVAIEQTKGSESEYTFIYPDGSEIVLDSIASRRAPIEFADQFYQNFRFVPEINRSDFLEMVNEWSAREEIEQIEVDPLSKEGRAREKVLKSIQRSTAVPEVDYIAALGEDTVVVWEEEGTILVPSDTIEEWVDGLDVSLRQTKEYLDPMLAGRSKRYYVEGTRERFWRIDLDYMESEGYTAPDTEPVPDSPSDPGASPGEVDDI